MPKQLALLSAEFDDIKKRVGPFLALMGMLDNNFWNATSGNWNRYYAGLDMLTDRLNALHVPNAAHPTAVADPEVVAILHGLVEAKAACLDISKEYWTNAARVEGVAREVVALKNKVDAVIRQKTDSLKKTSSLAALQSLSAHLNTFKNDLETACTIGGPHRPTHALLQ